MKQNIKHRKRMEKKQQNCLVLQNLSALILFLSFLPFTHPFDYKDALSKSILYFESQRSGPLPDNQRATWRFDSGLTDGLQEGVDLIGGYYDAGDNVKFGFPMAFTITMLSWSVIAYNNQIESAGEYQHALEAIKWGTDYFIKAHPKPHLLWAQVGDGRSDHKCWQRPEDMTTSRKAYFIDEKHPGSDLAGETAAAFAASSIVFRTINPPYARILLKHAEQLFEFADNFRGTYDKSIKSSKGFYTSWSGYKDELLWAAMWLYKATSKHNYLVYVIQNGAKLGGTTWFSKQFSWDTKIPGAQILASMLPNTTHTIFKQYRSAAEYYVCANLNKNNIKKKNVAKTRGGYIFINKWNNIQYAINAAFLLGVYSDHLAATNSNIVCSNGDSVGPNELLRFSKSQVDYILGSNPMNMSYLVGFGDNYPKKVHHRGASIVSYKEDKSPIECHDGYKVWFKREGPNPNVVVGAVVGGPDIHDRFRDERKNYMQTEACTYNNSPLVGILAKFYGVWQANSIDVAR